MALDAVDREILRILQTEGRVTNAELAQRIGLTPGPVLARVNKLETSGYIRGYAALVDHTLVGLPVTAFVSVILSNHGRVPSQQFVAAVLQLPEVLECHHIAGEEDFMLKVVASNPADLEAFVLERLCEVADVQRVKTTFVLSSPKYQTNIPVRENRI